MTDSRINLAIAGISGRLGRAIASEALRADDFRLVGGMVSSQSAHLHVDLGVLVDARHLGVSTVTALEDAVQNAQVLIDCTRPRVTAAIAPHLAALGARALVSAVTGLDAEQQAMLEKAAETLAVLQASNFSPGMALVERLVAQAARMLDANQYDLEIIETHHKRKTDFPSGAAISLGKAAAAARDATLEDVARFDRPRQGGHRPSGEIGFSAMRGGGVIGEHEARFLSTLEEITIGHRAFDRRVFARGALEAARWISSQKPGLYRLQDMLG